MTVQQLINELQKIEDKNLKVILNVNGCYNSGSDLCYGTIDEIVVETRTEIQDYALPLPCKAVHLFAGNGLSGNEIAEMRDKDVAPFAVICNTEVGRNLTWHAAVIDRDDNIVISFKYLPGTHISPHEQAEEECRKLNNIFGKEQK